MPEGTVSAVRSSEPVFVLGLGAQKTGTTWLHNYLQTSSGANMGFRKEYHIWDAVHVPSERGFRMQPDALHKPVHRALYLMQQEPGWYENYFRQLITGNTRLTGDLTPAYALLDARQLTQIKSRLEGVGFRVKVVFLLRDPVDRCFSAARMKVTRAGVPAADFAWLSNILFAALFDRPDQVARTRYEWTLQQVDRAFDPRDVHVGIYEEMFEPGSLERLSEFLGVDHRPQLADRYLMKSQSALLSEELAARCREHYATTYAACAERFPQTRALWRNSRENDR